MQVRRVLMSALGALVLAVPLWLGTTSPAEAGRSRVSSHSTPSATVVQTKTYSAPELDPSTAGAAAILLGGGALLLFDRRRRRRQA